MFVDTYKLDVGYLVNVVLHRSAFEKGPARGGSKLIERVKAVPQMTRIKLTPEWARAQFIKSILEPHGLADRYEAGPISGPEVLLWWTGYTYVYLSTYLSGLQDF